MERFQKTRTSLSIEMVLTKAYQTGVPLIAVCNEDLLYIGHSGILPQTFSYSCSKKIKINVGFIKVTNSFNRIDWHEMSQSMYPPKSLMKSEELFKAIPQLQFSYLLYLPKPLKKMIVAH